MNKCAQAILDVQRPRHILAGRNHLRIAVVGWNGLQPQEEYSTKKEKRHFFVRGQIEKS